jgi:lipoate-protein ligase A
MSMRVIDFGEVAPLRSQTLWHALGRAVRPGDGPTLSFVRPTAPYVCLGFHRDLAEVDTEFCAGAGLPVLRRLVGGGPVYLDADQCFYQISLPVGSVAAHRRVALADLLRPAVAALRSLGVDARLDRFGEISVGRAKVCGHGAGQLGDGVVVVGNLITAFDHRVAARALRLTPDARAQVLTLMLHHVHPTPVDTRWWKAAMVREYAAHFGRAARPGRMTATERHELERLDVMLARPDFVAGRPGPARPVRTVKVRAGVWVHEWATAERRAVLAVAEGAVRFVRGDLGDHLVGLSLEQARLELAADPDTTPLAAALATADTEVSAA